MPQNSLKSELKIFYSLDPPQLVCISLIFVRISVYARNELNRTQSRIVFLAYVDQPQSSTWNRITYVCCNLVKHFEWEAKLVPLNFNLWLLHAKGKLLSLFMRIIISRRKELAMYDIYDFYYNYASLHKRVPRRDGHSLASFCHKPARLNESPVTPRATIE